MLDPQSGAPLASRVAVATDLDGTPLILVSSLSEHTGGARSPTRAARCCSASQARAIRWRIRASAYAAGPRGCERGTPEQARAERRYLNRHPKAKLYAGFGDFAFFRLAVERASLNGGFGKAYHLTRTISFSTARQTTNSPMPSSRRSTT